MAEIDLLTPIERKRKERNESIIAEFKELMPEFRAKGYKPYRVFQALAKKYGMTTPGVRFVLVGAGVYTSADEASKSI